MQNETGAVVVYRVTTSLRYLRKWATAREPGVFVDGKKDVLQQAWLGSDGSVEWRDVSVVEET